MTYPGRQDLEAVENLLSEICASLRDSATWDRDGTKLFIEVGEYGLALNDLASVQLEVGDKMSDAISKKFVLVTDLLGIRGSEKYQSLKKILKTIDLVSETRAAQH